MDTLVGKIIFIAMWTDFIWIGAIVLIISYRKEIKKWFKNKLTPPPKRKVEDEKD